MMYSKKLRSITIKIKVPDKKQQQAKGGEALFGIARAIYKNLSEDQEHFTVLFLDYNLNVTGFKTLFTGGMKECIVDTRVLFRNALLFGASSIALVHNHPTGNLMFTHQDKEITSKIKEIGILIDIKLIDHLIISNDKYLSMDKTGMLNRL